MIRNTSRNRKKLARKISNVNRRCHHHHRHLHPKLSHSVVYAAQSNRNTNAQDAIYPTCNKTHKENHPPDQPIPVPQPDKPVPSSNGTSNSPQKNGSLNPFRVLDTSDDLRRLFRKYPNLAEQLLTIFAATQPPEEAPDKRIPASLMQGVAKKETWNHDIGIKNGKEALRKARDLKGEAGEAVREYSELVLHLMNTGDDKGQASTVLQRQVAQEDSKLIEKLMAQERG
ncbi:hypothetical protein E4U36_001860 [Claviceps purpurea]|nr:hypothetical protein E4U36_001860 [Claviceps purpurea]